MVDPAARTPDVEFHGSGESRELKTQADPKGVGVALMQEAQTQEGGVYTITFGVQPPTAADGSAVPFQCEAEIRWSERGNTVTRRVSVIQGMSISTAGRVVSIRAFDVTPATLPETDNVPTPGANSKYIVTALVERGNRAAEGRPPTLYEGILTLAGHGATEFAIPQGWGIISLEVTAVQSAEFPSARPNATVQFVTAAGGIFKAYDPTINTGFVAIPPGATAVALTNADASNAAIFTITWGIDG